MSWSIQFTRSARSQLEKLPEKVATAAVEFIYGPLCENPYRVGKPLRFELEGKYSARRGSYRVIYAVDQAKSCVRIHNIGHRADIYGRR